MHRPGHITTGRRLHHTDVVRVQGGSQGLERSGRCFGPLAGCMERLSSKKKSNLPLFDHLVALCVPQTGHNTMGRRLLQTDLGRVQVGSQGSGRCGRYFGPSAGANSVDPAQNTREIVLILSTCGPLCASPRAHTTGRRLLRTDLVCMKGGPQGPGRCVRCTGPSAEGTGCRSSIRCGITGPYFVKF